MKELFTRTKKIPRKYFTVTLYNFFQLFWGLRVHAFVCGLCIPLIDLLYIIIFLSDLRKLRAQSGLAFYRRPQGHIYQHTKSYVMEIVI